MIYSHDQYDPVSDIVKELLSICYRNQARVMKDKITKQAVESLKPGAKDRIMWDTELPMFGCKVTPKGRRVYLLQYRIEGRSRRYTIGIHGSLTTREARKIAKKLLHDIALNRDPADMRRRIKEIKQRVRFKTVLKAASSRLLNSKLLTSTEIRGNLRPKRIKPLLYLQNRL